MPVRWTTAGQGVALHIEAATPQDVFGEAAAAFSTVAGGEPTGAPDRMPVLLRAEGLDALLARFVEDLLELVELEGFTARRLERVQFEGDGLRAAVSGHTGPVRLRVVGATGSGPSYDDVGGTWRARVDFTLRDDGERGAPARPPG